MTQPKLISAWLLVGAAAAAGLFVVLFLYLEAQSAIAYLALGLAVSLYSAARGGLFAMVDEASSEHPRLAISTTVLAGIAVIILLRDQHFAMLMFATFCLFVTVCLGMTIQFGYDGFW